MEEKDTNHLNTGGQNGSSKNDADQAFPHVSVATQDQHFQFLSQKAQRLSTALYMLTNLFEHSDPLHQRLRELSL
ncbi:MAG: hypothetical protein PHV42_01975, partial [Candidatus Pacebacteria bacterium]|nr:hypothetical protein [Candidatus Paceibacterota bacterium]